MTWSQIREYISGWARFQKRIHGSKAEGASEIEDIPDVSPEEQAMLAQQMMRRPQSKKPKPNPASPPGNPSESPDTT
jgi:hypothetical protein